MLKSAKGFTLIEVVIAAAALAGLALVGMQLQKSNSKSTTKNSFDSETTLVTNEMVAILSDPDKCLATLGGRNAQSTTTGINSINGKFNSIASGSSPANGYGNANLEIANYELNATPAEVASNNSKLNIIYKNKNILKGQETIKKSINLYVDVDGANNITKCRSLSSSSSDIWTRGANGNIYYSGGNVGVNTNSPSVSLDVNGGIRPGSSGVTIGSACTGEGTFAYDIAEHSPVYCASDSTWKKMGGGLNCTTRTGTPTATCLADEVVLGGSCDLAVNHFSHEAESRCVWTYHQNFTANGFTCSVTSDSEVNCYGRQQLVNAYARCCKSN